MSRRSANAEDWTVLLCIDPNEQAVMSRILTGAGYRPVIVSTLDERLQDMDWTAVKAVILDIDLPLSVNPTIRELSLRTPAKPLLCVSRERFHPELKESFLKHIYACLTKPVDPEELLYWLKSIEEDRSDVSAGKSTRPPAEE